MAAKNGRNVSLTDEQDALVDRLVESGRYASASEVVRDGLRLLQRNEESRLLEKWLLAGLTTDEKQAIPSELLSRAQASIRAKIAEGLESARRGEFENGEAFFSRWKARLDAAQTSTNGKENVKPRA